MLIYTDNRFRWGNRQYYHVLHPGDSMDGANVFGVEGDGDDPECDMFVIDVHICNEHEVSAHFWNGRESDEDMCRVFINMGCIEDNDHDYYALLDNTWETIDIDGFDIRRRTTRTGPNALYQSDTRFERYVIHRKCDMPAITEDEIVVRQRDRWVKVSGIDFYCEFSSFHENMALIKDQPPNSNPRTGAVYTRSPEWYNVFVNMTDRERFEYMSDVWQGSKQIVLK